jgi:hypothetical protein
MAVEIDEMLRDQELNTTHLEPISNLQNREATGDLDANFRNDAGRRLLLVESNSVENLEGNKSSVRKYLNSSPSTVFEYASSVLRAIVKFIAARPIVSGVLALVLFGGFWLFASPTSGVKMSNEMDKYALEYISRYNILLLSEKLIAYYDVTTKMDGTEAALLTNQRIIYHKNNTNTSINLSEIADVKHRSEAFGDTIEVFSTSGQAMKIEIALWNGGETFKSALVNAWNKAKGLSQVDRPITSTQTP